MGSWDQSMMIHTGKSIQVTEKMSIVPAYTVPLDFSALSVLYHAWQSFLILSSYRLLRSADFNLAAY